MTTIRLLPLTALLTVGTLFGGGTPVLAEISVSAVLDAIKEEHCIGEYWAPRPSRPSEVWPVTVRIDGDVAFAWVERLEKPKTQWATFYAVAFKGGKAIITSRMGYNTDIMRKISTTGKARTRCLATTGRSTSSVSTCIRPN
jgi:hypothetical protein